MSNTLLLALLNPYALHFLDVDVFPKLKLCIINLLFGVVFVIMHANDFWVLCIKMKYRKYMENDIDERFMLLKPFGITFEVALTRLH